MWLYLLGVVLYLHIKKYSMKFMFIFAISVDILMGLHQLIFALNLCQPSKRFMADNLLPCAAAWPTAATWPRLQPLLRALYTKALFLPTWQQLCLLSPQHQAWIFQLYRQLCASIRALQPHEPCHWQWPFTSGQFPVSRQASCCIIANQIVNSPRQSYNELPNLNHNVFLYKPHDFSFLVSFLSTLLMACIKS